MTNALRVKRTHQLKLVVCFLNYDTVIMTVNATKVAKSSIEAKEKVQETVRLIDRAISELKETHGVTIKPGCLVASYDVEPHSEYQGHQHVHVGYAVRYGLQFKTSNVDKASIIQDVLTSVPNVIVQTPDFRVADEEALKCEALKNAWEKVSRRLNDQWKILIAPSEASKNHRGSKPPTFGILSWKVDYERRGGFGKAAAIEAATNSCGDGAIQIESGKARVEVILTVDFG